eukprot:gene13850-16332_t
MNVKDPKMKNHLLEKANIQFEGIRSLVENRNLIKYPCSIRIIPEVSQKAKILLSTKSQDKMKKKKWGFMDRVMVVFSKS